MTIRVLEPNRLLWRALVASLALHFLFALLLPAWIPKAAPELQPVETLTFAHVVRLEIEHRHPAAAPKAAPRFTRAVPSALPPSGRPEISAPAPRARLRPLPDAPRHASRPAAAPAAPVAGRGASVGSQTAGESNGSAASQGVGQPAPVPSAQPKPGAGTSSIGGVMPFGEEQDPVLDPRALAALTARFAVHVTLRVTVGENGRTERVVFVPPLDPQTEASIEAFLADAEWDAAICGGGVSCEGTATIKI